eukprot:3246943-Pleurochrysis_carterae.AAC.1
MATTHGMLTAMVPHPPTIPSAFSMVVGGGVGSQRALRHLWLLLIPESGPCWVVLAQPQAEPWHIRRMASALSPLSQGGVCARLSDSQHSRPV